MMHIALKCVCRHSNNRNPCIISAEISDLLCRLITAETGHMDIHQNQIIRRFLGVTHDFHCRIAIFRHAHLIAQMGEHFLRDFPVHAVILDQQYSVFVLRYMTKERAIEESVTNMFRRSVRHNFGCSPDCAVLQPELQMNDDLGSFILLAECSDRSAHRIHNTLADRHPESAASNLTDG